MKSENQPTVFYKMIKNVLFICHESLNVKQLYLLHLDMNLSLNEVISMIFAKRKQNMIVLLPSGSVGRSKNVNFLLIHFPLKRDSSLFGHFPLLIFVFSSFCCHFFPQMYQQNAQLPPNIPSLVQ